MSTELAKNAIDELKHYMSLSKIQTVFEEMLGENAGIFINSITNVVRGNLTLQKCDPQSIVNSAIDAAALDLPIDPSLGLAAIVPYKGKAQFQIMYKGVIQLCIRSGQYATIDCTEIYSDELLSHNPITKVTKFKDPAGYEMRDKKQDKNVIGHYAYFRLTSGFEKSDYMSHAEAMAHGEKYSKAYQYDLKQKKRACPWSLFPMMMCNKTVLKRLLDKYGIKSIKIQNVFARDNSFEAAQEVASEQIKNEQGSEVVDAEFEPTEDKPAKKTKKKTAKKKAQAKPETEEPAVDEEFFYECLECGNKFNDPKVTGTGDDAKPCCPNMWNRDEKACFSPNIKKLQE